MSVDHNKNKAGITGSQSSSSAPGPAPGGRIKGRYLIERELGRGGVGVVFLARDERLHGMPVVIKFLLAAAEQNKWLTGKFSQEAEALTRINHPGVVRVIDRDNSDDGRPFFVMEFIKGRPLREIMNQGPVDLAYAANLVRQTGNALHAAHQQGVIHRDLKPENVMLEQLSGGDEQVKLIDFGIAKVVNPQAGNETEVAVVAGSRQYIAPEQLLSQMATPATDIYAMAIIVYEMVTGCLPFNPQGATHFLVMQELMRLQRNESFIRPRSFRPDLPEAAQILLLNALSFDAARRPQNSRVFAEDLAQALLGLISADDARATSVIPLPGSESPSDTEIYTDVDEARATDANAAAQTSAPKSPTKGTAPVAAGRETFSKQEGRKFPIAGALIIVIALAATAMITVRTLWPSVWQGLINKAANSPSPQAPSPGPASPEATRIFNYSFIVRSDPEKSPNDPPYETAREVLFARNDRVHVLFSSPQAGYLYIINEGPQVAGQDTSFNILFPTPTANNGSAQLAADKTFRIPEHDSGFVLDTEKGTEKLWLIWADNELPKLESLKRLANPNDKGEIKNADEVKFLRDFLAERSATQPQISDDDKRTTVKIQGNILVKLVKLAHR